MGAILFKNDQVFVEDDNRNADRIEYIALLNTKISEQIGYYHRVSGLKPIRDAV